MPQSPAAAEALYRPHPSTNQLKEIVENSIEELFRVWIQNPPLHKPPRS